MSLKKNLFLMLVLALMVALAACGGKNDATPTPETPGTPDTPAPAEGEAGGHLVFVTGADAPTLDPHGMNDTATSNATSQIFERLTDYAADGSVYGLLATEFEAIDELTWEFKLRQGVKFHDGSDFTANDVKASIERLIDPEAASPRAFILNMVEEVVIVDDHTVQIKTNIPFAPLPAHLAHNAGSIIQASAIEEENNGGKTITEHPIGTGPFKLTTWDRGAEIKMERNEDYWGEKAKVDTLSFVVVPEDATRIAMLETGEAHAVLVGAPDVARVEGMSQLDTVRIHGTRMDYLGFNMNKAPYDNMKVRQAIAMAVNKDDIVYGILDGQGVPAVGPLAPTVNGNYQGLTPLDYDVEAAKALLAEAGFENGFNTTIFVNEGNKARADIAELVQHQLGQIGINVEIKIVEWGAFLEQTAAGDHELFILGWTTVTGDADYGLYALFHSSQHGSPGNRSFYSNDRVDELLDYARSEADQPKRNEAYKEISEILVEEAPMVYLQHPDFVYGTNGVTGLFVDFGGTPYFKGVSFK
jgi:peptide/nickel transport system substrate-binding protein